jgi:hypothetical protein
MPEETTPKPQSDNLATAMTELDQDIKKLDETMEELDDQLEQSIKAQGWWPTLLRGVIGALGAAVGATLIIGAIVYLLQQLTDAPVFGQYVNGILQQFQQNK